MLQALLFFLVATIWVRLARILCVAAESPLMQVLVFVVSPIIYLHIFVMSVAQCVLDWREV